MQNDIPQWRGKGIAQENRRRLDVLHRMTSPFSVHAAAEALEMDLPRARRFLAYLAERGWLVRVRRGLYAPVPLGAGMGEWREEPWVVATRLFTPCYLGGWTACEHWGFTEQIFRDVVVLTALPVRERLVRVQGTGFRLRHLPEEKHFGLRYEWLGKTRVAISDPERTLVDVLDEPWLGAGIRHVAEVLGAYFEFEDRNEAKLLAYGERLGNRTVFKRLGYLAEALDLGTTEFVAACHKLQSSGLSALDPAVRDSGTIVKRWNLRVNVPLGGGGEAG